MSESTPEPGRCQGPASVSNHRHVTNGWSVIGRLSIGRLPDQQTMWTHRRSNSQHQNRRGATCAKSQGYLSLKR